MYIFICTVKTIIHSPTWKLKQNKCTHKCFKKKKTHHESDDLNRINSRKFTCLPLFALLRTQKEKRQSHVPVNLKNSDFAPAGVDATSSSRTFHPEATGEGGKFQSKKLYRLKRKLLHSHLTLLKSDMKRTHTYRCGCPCSIMVKATNCGILKSKFKLQSCYYIHIQTNTLMNPLILPAIGFNSTTAVLLEEWFWHWITYKGWYAFT